MHANELDVLAQSREQFLAFVRRRIADPELAEDVLQTSLTKAVQHFDSLKDSDNLVPWFYSILRNAITDAYRTRAGATEVALPETFDVADESTAHLEACQCFYTLLPLLKPEYAEVISALDLRNESASATAERLGVTANNLKVRHHRARQALRRQLEYTCRVCAQHHCLDCTCREELAAPKNSSEHV